MHRLRLAAVAATLLALLFPAASAGSIIAVRGPLEPGAGDVLARQLSYYGDFGRIAVGEGDAAALAKLRALGFAGVELGPWTDDLRLYVADPEHVARDARVLLRHRGQVLFAAGDAPLPAGCPHHLAEVERVAWHPTPGFQAAPAGLLQAVTADSRITPLVAQVSKANLQATVQHLAAYHTRRSDQPTALLAKDWLVQQLQAIPGLTVSTHLFQPGDAPNVVAEIPGAVHPGRVVVLGAHYDSINQAGPTAVAPGADDNASGTAGILETARILAQGQFENTVRLVLFASEEFGLDGSQADAALLGASSAQVIGMLNMDMIAHRDAGDALDLDLATNSTDPGLTQFCADVTAVYVPGLGVQQGVLTAGSSDHAAYQAAGIPAAFFFEDLTGYSAVIHTGADLYGTSANDFDLARGIVQAFVATGASLAKPVDLQIAHVPLADSTDTGGPYAVRATVTSLIGTAVAGVDVVWRAGGSPWTTRALVATTTPGEWLGSIPGVAPSGDVEYYLLAEDTAGHEEWHPEGTAPGAAVLGFTVGTVDVGFFDDCEQPGANGWTHVTLAGQDDWQRGPPSGKAGDPAAAFSGGAAWGNDLGPTGWNGAYQPDVLNRLESPVVDCSQRSGLRLRYRRWLTVEDGFYDQATIRVNGQPVWQNPATPGGGADHLLDTLWTLHDVDVSALADGNPAVRVAFELATDGGLEFGGWNIDDVALLSIGPGTRPELVASDVVLSASQGGTIGFSFAPGPAHAGKTYVLGISTSGTAPATVIDGTAVPLVFDLATQVGFALLNGPLFQGFGGVLPPAGTTTATLALPPSPVPALPGLTLHVAAFTVAPVGHASNAVTVTFGM